MAIENFANTATNEWLPCEIVGEQTTDDAHRVRFNARDMLLTGNPASISENQPSYKDKLISTIFVMIVYVALGSTYTCTSASFLDLLQHTETNIGKGSVLFAMVWIGYMTGSFISGILYDKFDKDLVYVISITVAGIATMFVPWPKSFSLMTCLLFFTNIWLGSLDSGSFYTCAMIWRDDANPFLQSLPFCYATGGMLAPFLTEPFFLQSDNLGSTNVSFPINISSTAMELPHFNVIALIPLVETFTNYTTYFQSNSQGSTQLYVPFLIIGMFTVISSVHFWINIYQKFISGKTATTATGPAATLETTTTIPLRGQRLEIQASRPEDMSQKTFVFTLILIGTFFLAQGCYFSLADFSMPYVVNHLGWSKSEGARLLSGMWGTYAVSAFICIFVSKFVNPCKMLTAELFLISAGLIGLLSVAKSKEIMWICYLVIFTGLGPLYATGICWVDQNLIRLSGKICSIFVVSFFGASASNSLLLGHLFDRNLPQWNLYIVSMTTCCEWLVLIIMYVLSRTRLSRPRSSVVTDNLSI